MNQISGSIIPLSIDQGADRITHEIARLPKLAEDFRLCAIEEKLQQRRKYCALLQKSEPSSTQP